MFGLGAGEIFIILAFALIFIGPKKLPELARNLGKGIREFQKAKDDLMTQVNESSQHEDKLQEDHHPNLTGVNEAEEFTTPTEAKADPEVDKVVDEIKDAMQKNSEEKSS